MPLKPLTMSLAARENKAQVRIIGDIFDWSNSCQDFDRQVSAMVDSGVKDVELYIYSGGGSCFEANEIVNIIKKFPGKISCVGGAIVASAASYIAINCNSFAMPANGLLMIHKPSLDASGNEDAIESQLSMLKSMTDIYCKAYARKTGMSEQQVTDFWATERWMGAGEALEKKFCDSVVTDEAIDKTDIDQMIAGWGYSSIPTALVRLANNLQNNQPLTQKFDTMKKVIKLFADLTDDATEDQIAAKVSETLSENKVLKDKIDGFEAQAKEAMKRESESLVDAAVKDGRIDASAKEHFLKMFVSNHESTKAALMAMKPHANVSGRIGGQQGQEDKLVKMSWDEADKAGKLGELREKYPESYKEKFKEKFGKDPKNA